MSITMFKSRSDVDRHVESLSSKLSANEFKLRTYSIARLYFDVGDYESCRRYAEQYISYKDNNAAAHKLLGQTFQKLDMKEKALEHFKTSLDIDSTQTSIILDICDLLADNEIDIDPGRAQYWCEKAESVFPRHPSTYRLREKLLLSVNPNPQAIIDLLISELKTRPNDIHLQARLIKNYMQSNKIKEAFEHSFSVEFREKNNFVNNLAWYEALWEVVVNYEQICNQNDWDFQLLKLTTAERLVYLSLNEVPTNSSKSLQEVANLLHQYDQEIQKIHNVSHSPGFAEFHQCLLLHHQGQLCLHIATFLLKKAKKEQLSWRDATQLAAPLMLLAWHIGPQPLDENWLTNAPEKQQVAVRRWHLEGSFRCSQSGHYLLSNLHDKTHTFLDKVSQLCTSLHWKDKVYEKIFTNREHIAQTKDSFFINVIENPTLRLPRKSLLENYDMSAQRMHPASLHHQVWIVSCYKSLANYNCTIFDKLTPKSATFTSCSPETLNKYDTLAFLYCTALTARNGSSSNNFIKNTDKPIILPAAITDMMCNFSQAKWWDCSYKMSQNEFGKELTDVRSTLSRGIEVIRCVDNHGLDPKLLCLLGQIFSEKSQKTNKVEEKKHLELRAKLYYSSAVPLLERLKNNISMRIPEKRMFDYVSEEITPKELTALIEESKLFLGVFFSHDNDFDKATEMLTDLKSPQASYNLAIVYKKMASCEAQNSCDTDNETETRQKGFLMKAKENAYLTLDRLKSATEDVKVSLNSDVYQLIESLESDINRHGLYPMIAHNEENNCSSDSSSIYSPPEHSQITYEQTSRIRRNISSTPNRTSFNINSHYKSTIDPNSVHSIESIRNEKKYENLENQLKHLQKKDASIHAFHDETKMLIEQNKILNDEVRELKTILNNQVVASLNNSIKNTVDQFKLLKISVNEVKEEVTECKSDISDLRKQISDLKKNAQKTKSANEKSDHADDTNSYGEDYRANASTPTFPQIPFLPQHLLPPNFAPRIPAVPLPPAAYSMYQQNLYGLYSQLAQPPMSSLFESSRPPTTNYSSGLPTLEQFYNEMASLYPPVPPESLPGTVPPGTLSSAPVLPGNLPMHPNALPVPAMPPGPLPLSSMPPGALQIPNMPPVALPVPALSSSVSIPPPQIPHSLPTPSVATRPLHTISKKETIPKALPVNVVITSSDPLPTATSSPQPIMSVTIPPEHIKGSPHNYQIAMPSINESQVQSVFKTEVVNSSKANFNPWNSPSLSSQVNKLSSQDFSFSGHKNSVIAQGNTSAEATPNSSLNKSRTFSEKSNTSVENYDPCPDFKPIVPLPAEVNLTTGEENEAVVFSARAKLYRFVDKEWKERGLGEMKLLKHKHTEKVRVLMRREQIHKICANHIITADMEIKPMKNESKAYFWVANDFAEEKIILEKFSIRFKTPDIAKDFYDTFEKARQEASTRIATPKKTEISEQGKCTETFKKSSEAKSSFSNKTVGGFSFNSTPLLKTVNDTSNEDTKKDEKEPKPNPFSGFTFKSSNATNLTSKLPIQETKSPASMTTQNKLNSSDTLEDFVPTAEFTPVVPLPALIETKTGEEEENILFEHRAKLLRLNTESKEWKERGIGNIKLLVRKDDNQKIRLLMRREQVMKVCCNHALSKDMVFQKKQNVDKAVTWCAKDFSEGELVTETFCVRFKTADACNDFLDAICKAQNSLNDQNAPLVKNNTSSNKGETKIEAGFGEKFKPKAGSWSCPECFVLNEESAQKCICCEHKNPTAVISKQPSSQVSEKSSAWGDKFKPKSGTWECQQCLIRNDANLNECSACQSPKDPSVAKTEQKSIFGNIGASTFKFGMPTTNVNSSTPSAPGKSLLNFAALLNKQSEAPKSFTFGMNNGVAAQSTATNAAEAPGFRLPLVSNSSTVTSTPIKDAHTSFAPDKNGVFEFKLSPKSASAVRSPVKSPRSDDSDGEYEEDDGQHIQFTPLIPLPEKIKVTTGEEDETVLFCHRAKLFRFMAGEWKERGIGDVKILKHKENGKLRVLMRREHIHKLCLNHLLTSDIIYTPQGQDEKTWLFTANDFSENELCLQQFCLRFKTKEIASSFKKAADDARSGVISLPKQSDSPDDVVFVGEIQASSEEKLKAKELMLPENFYTYKNKDPCRGCRGCENESATSSSRPATPEGTDKSVEASVFRTHLAQQSSSSISENENTTAESLSDKENSSFSSQQQKSKVSEERTLNTSRGSLLAPPKLNTAVGSLSSNKNESTKSETPLGFQVKNENEKTVLGAKSANTLAEKKDNKNASGSRLSGSIQDTKSQEPAAVFGVTQEKSISFEQAPSTNVFIQQPTFSFSQTSTESNPRGLFSKPIFAPKLPEGSIFSQAQSYMFGNQPEQSKTSRNTELETKSNEQPVSIFSGQVQKDIFGGKGLFGATEQPKSNGPLGASESIFGSNAKPTFSSSNEAASLFSTMAKQLQQVQPSSNADSGAKPVQATPAQGEPTATLFGGSDLSFAKLSSGTVGFEKKENFQWEGAGQQLFTGAKKTPSKNPSVSLDKSANESAEGETADVSEEYDPHYEPIVPLPDKIVVTTGEEDEEKLFGERAKLFRYDEGAREWKERGVGEIKLLHHPERRTYRLLLRREQVHKAVLNALLHIDLELLPMKNSDKSWTFAALNYAESASGEQETLALRFKSCELANSFRDRVVECVRKLQAAKAQKLREEQESASSAGAGASASETRFASPAPLRLPRHVPDTARADLASPPQPAPAPAFSTTHAPAQAFPAAPTYTFNFGASSAQQDRFNRPAEEAQANDEEEYEDYDEYKDEEEAEGEGEGDMVLCEYVAGARVTQAGAPPVESNAAVEIIYDAEYYTPRVLVTDAATGEILADTHVYTDTHFQVQDNTCTWSGQDYTCGNSEEKTVALTFDSAATTSEFVENCQKSCCYPAGETEEA